MYAYAIAQAFTSAFQADPAFAGYCLQNGQTGDLKTRTPGAVVFECKIQPLTAGVTSFTFALTVTVESTDDRPVTSDPASAPDPAIAHAALVDLVRAKLLGSGRTALLAALNAPAVFDFRGWSPAESDQAVQQGHLKTPLMLNGIALVF